MPLIVEVWFLHLRTCLIKTSFQAKSENLRPCSSFRDEHTDARTDGRTYKHTRSITYTRYAIARPLKTVQTENYSTDDHHTAQYDEAHQRQKFWIQKVQVGRIAQCSISHCQAPTIFTSLDTLSTVIKMKTHPSFSFININGHTSKIQLM
jgi:hypothetical protein